MGIKTPVLEIPVLVIPVLEIRAMEIPVLEIPAMEMPVMVNKLQPAMANKLEPANRLQQEITNGEITNGVELLTLLAPIPSVVCLVINSPDCNHLEPRLTAIH